MSAHLQAARHSLALALSDVERCLPRPGDDWRQVAEGEGLVRWVHVSDTGIPGCASCKRIKQYVPARKGSTYCDWCARWIKDPKNPTRKEPLVELLALHHAGKRITDQAVKQAEAEYRRKEAEAKERSKRKRKVKR